VVEHHHLPHALLLFTYAWQQQYSLHLQAVRCPCHHWEHVCHELSYNGHVQVSGVPESLVEEGPGQLMLVGGDVSVGSWALVGGLVFTAPLKQHRAPLERSPGGAVVDGVL
jgi:hypothetical protein